MFKECLIFTQPLDLNLQHENTGEEKSNFRIYLIAHLKN